MAYHGGPNPIGEPGIRAVFEYKSHSGIDLVKKSKEVVTTYYSPKITKSVVKKIEKISVNNRRRK